MNAIDDWYSASSLTEAADRIETPHVPRTTNVYVISGSERTVLVDAGRGIGNLAGFLESLVGTEVRLVLTHSDWDHIGNAHQFDDVAIHPSERGDNGQIAIDTLSDEFVRRPAQLVADMRGADLPFPDGFDPDDYEIPAATGVDAVKPGTEIDLGDRILEAIALPGHSPGHLGFLDHADGILYGGDVIHAGAGLYLHFQHSDLAACYESLARLRRLRDENAFDALATCHNSPYTGDDLSLIDTLFEGLEAIIANDLSSEIVEMSWGPARQYVVEGSSILTKMETEA